MARIRRMSAVMLRYFHTLRYLKWRQISFRIYYQIRNRFQFLRPAHFSHVQTPPAQQLVLIDSIPSHGLYLGKGTFRFLNLLHAFEGQIAWNFSDYGKLWTYNLSYFEYLSQVALSSQTGLALIKQFVDQETTIKDGMEPFPISLRTVFWVKFLIRYQIKQTGIDQSLYRQLQRLSANVEYHLLGNHLLENGFGLLFGACYFSDLALYRQADSILKKQLEEQILGDGAHFELSPMYHCLILFRLLDSVNLLQHNPSPMDTGLLSFLQEKAGLMLGWLQAIIFSNGDLPHVNDSTDQIAPQPQSLLDYGRKLGMLPRKVTLNESGYRKFQTDRYELLLDVGRIGPDYIPGHAHSDTFNFILYHRGKPLLVDPGISTYEKNERRQLERSTAFHNTVMVDDQEQSEVWGGFRVAARARIVALSESDDFVEAGHDGYRKIGALHTRRFELGPGQITITDHLTGDKPAKAFFHFHPDVQLELKNNVLSGAFGEIRFQQFSRIYFEDYDYCTGFNSRCKSIKAIVDFEGYVITKIYLP